MNLHDEKRQRRRAEQACGTLEHQRLRTFDVDFHDADPALNPVLADQRIESRPPRFHLMELIALGVLHSE